MAKDTSDQTTDTNAAPEPLEEPTSGRPWSMAAAMEPLPPLAPPVEEPLPGTGRISIAGAHSKHRSGSRLWVILLALALIAVCVLLFLHDK